MIFLRFFRRPKSADNITENHGVGGSIPPLGTIKIRHLARLSMLRFPVGKCNTFALVLNGSSLFPASQCNMTATWKG